MLRANCQHCVRSTSTTCRLCHQNSRSCKKPNSRSPAALTSAEFAAAERKRTAAAVLLSTIFLGVGFFYKQLHSFKEKLKLTSSATEIEKLQKNYIYVEKHALGDYEREMSKKKKKRKRNKPPWFPWIQSRGHDPWTLLRLAQSDDHSIRLLGVHSLTEEHHWTDAEYRMLAQALDDKTVVGLARSKKANPKFFLPPPELPPTKEVLEDQLRELLSSLPTDNLDKCTKYFTSTALQEGSQVTKEDRGGLWCFGGNGLAFTESLSAVPPETVELYCLQALLKHSADSVWNFANLDWFSTQPVKVKSTLRLEELFLVALLGHSQVPSHCPHIIRLGGLVVLKRIYDNRQNNIRIVRAVVRILSNLAAHDQLHHDIIRAGWVTILAEWNQSPDLSLSLHAAKALANLDADFGTRRYVDGIYLYYPQHRYSEPVYSDVVFVHGLLGGPFRSWRQADPSPTSDPKVGASGSDAATESGASNNQKDDEKMEKTVEIDLGDLKEEQNDDSKESSSKAYTMCWPKDWLAVDCPHIRIMTVEYETHLSEWAPKCPFGSEKRTLASRSAELITKLRRAGVGERPVIWVGHSMGGLLIKQMLTQAKNDPSLKNLVDRTKGIIFYSVPHRGAPLAAYGNHTKYLIYPSVEVKELHQESKQLLTLHDKFKELMFEEGIPLLSFAEGEKTQLPLNLKILMVPRESSDPGFGEFHFMDSLNHLNICKPANKMSPLYQLTLEFIRHCIPLNLVENILRANIPEEYILPEDFEM